MKGDNLAWDFFIKKEGKLVLDVEYNILNKILYMNKISLTLIFNGGR
jgi:hypothetical protein